MWLDSSNLFGNNNQQGTLVRRRYYRKKKKFNTGFNSTLILGLQGMFVAAKLRIPLSSDKRG